MQIGFPADCHARVFMSLSHDDNRSQRTNRQLSVQLGWKKPRHADSRNYCRGAGTNVSAVTCQRIDPRSASVSSLIASREGKGGAAPQELDVAWGQYMPDLSLDLRYLRYAILVREHGSFRSAAEALNTSQSAVSRRIQLLERRLGVTLFERGPTGARPTIAGARFIRSAAVGSDQLQQAIMEARRAHRGEIGELRVGAGTSLANGALADLLERYRASFPLVDLRVEEIACLQSRANLLNNGIDVAFLLGHEQSPNFKARKLWRERFVAALPRSHPLAGRARIDWSDLRAETLLLPSSEQGGEMESFLMGKMADFGSMPRIVTHRVGRDSLLGMAARGFGVFVTLEPTSGDRHGSVCLVPLGDDADSVSLSVVWSAQDRNPTVAPFVEFAASQSLET